MNKTDELWELLKDDNYWAIKASFDNIQWMNNWLNGLKIRFEQENLSKSACQIIQGEIEVMNLSREIVNCFSWAEINNDMVFEVVKLMMQEEE